MAMARIGVLSLLVKAIWMFDRFGSCGAQRKMNKTVA